MPSRATRSRNRFFSAGKTGANHPNQLLRPAASARFSSTVIPGALPRMGSWNSRPMTRARLCSGVRVMSFPSRRILPVSTMKLPAMALKRVDFPAPLAPIMVMKSPSATFSDRSSRGFLALMDPGLKVLEM